MSIAALLKISTLRKKKIRHRYARGGWNVSPRLLLARVFRDVSFLRVIEDALDLAQNNSHVV